VVGASPDDAGRDTPDGHAQDEIPVAAATHVANPCDPDANRDCQQQHQAVHVHDERAEIDDAAVR
jgi:hypothetical protein